MDQGTLKKMAADAAVEYVRDGQIVGLGTGSTVRYVVAKLAERIKKGLRIQGVATSLEAARLSRRATDERRRALCHRGGTLHSGSVVSEDRRSGGPGD